MSRKRPPSAVLPWERRSPALTWLTRDRLGVAARVVLVGVAFWGLTSAESYRRKTFATRAAIRSVTLAAEAFRADYGRCPATADELVHPPEVPGGTARYLADVRLDGWGRPLRLTCPGWKHPSSVDVVSGGPSGTFLDLEQLE